MHRHGVDEILQETEQKNERQRPKPQAAIADRFIDYQQEQAELDKPEYHESEPGFVELVDTLRVHYLLLIF